LLAAPGTVVTSHQLPGFEKEAETVNTVGDCGIPNTLPSPSEEFPEFTPHINTNRQGMASDEYELLDLLGEALL
jgi:hypothetical protein